MNMTVFSVKAKGVCLGDAEVPIASHIPAILSSQYARCRRRRSRGGSDVIDVIEKTQIRVVFHVFIQYCRSVSPRILRIFGCRVTVQVISR
jgi:hypothetical protein